MSESRRTRSKVPTAPVPMDELPRTSTSDPVWPSTRVDVNDNTLTVTLKLLVEQLHENKSAYRDMRAGLDALSEATAMQIEATRAMTKAIQANTDELSGLRMQRAKGGNGHARHDDLSSDHNEGDSQ